MRHRRHSDLDLTRRALIVASVGLMVCASLFFCAGLADADVLYAEAASVPGLTITDSQDAAGCAHAHQATPSYHAMGAACSTPSVHASASAEAWTSNGIAIGTGRYANTVTHQGLLPWQTPTAIFAIEGDVQATCLPILGRDAYATADLRVSVNRAVVYAEREEIYCANGVVDLDGGSEFGGRDVRVRVWVAFESNVYELLPAMLRDLIPSFILETWTTSTTVHLLDPTEWHSETWKDAIVEGIFASGLTTSEIDLAPGTTVRVTFQVDFRREGSFRVQLPDRSAWVTSLRASAHADGPGSKASSEWPNSVKLLGIVVEDPGAGAAVYLGDEYHAVQAQTQCSDGLDNDGNGYADYPEDPLCASLIDDFEGFTMPACGLGWEVAPCLVLLRLRRRIHGS